MSELRLDADEARNRLYDIMNEESTFETKVQQALELGTAYLGVENGYLSQIDPQMGSWEATVSTDSGDGPFPAGTVDLKTTYCRQTIKQDTSVAIHDASAQGWADDLAVDAHGLVCYHGTAISINDDTYGVLCFVSTAPREPFTDAETIFAELMARLLEHELERQEHESELDRRSMMITVLNRVLRHNLRNSMTVIRGHAQMAGEEFRWPPRELQTVINRADKLIQLSEKARKLESVSLNKRDRKETDLLRIVRGLSQDLRDEYPAASISVQGYDETALAIRPSLETAFEELLENAVKHTGDEPEVTVSVESVPNAVEITITDCGPGLSNVEQKVLTTGVETPLTHGVGLGHWLVYWIVTSHDGTIEADASEDGTEITVRLPKDVSPSVTPARDHGEKQLQRVQDKFRTVFDEASDAMVLVDDAAQIIDANESAGTLFDRPTTDLFGFSMGTFVTDGTTFQRAWQSTSSVTHERGTVRICRSDATERIAEYTTTTNVIPGEHLIVLRDVTDQRAQQQQLKETTERLEATIDASPDPIVCVDCSGAIQMWNPAAERTFGWTEDEVLGEQPPMLSDESLESFNDCLDAALSGNRVEEREARRRSKSGDILDVSISTAPIRGLDGDISGMVAVVKDISERKRRERELEVKTRAIEKAPVSTVITDASEPTNPIIYTNEAFEQLTGYTEAESVGRNCRFLQGPKTDSDTVKAIREAIATEDPISVEILNYRRDGTTFWNQNTLAPVVDDSGTVTHYVGFQQDITDRRNREQELAQVAHDLQNPLTVASGHLEMVTDASCSEHIEAASQALSRMDDLITDVLSLARQERPIDETESVELSSIVTQCWRWIDTDTAALSIEDEMTFIADTSRLKQLLENLFGNALDHGGSAVTVRVGTINGANGFYVADDGTGIPDNEQSRVFESGYSTSEDGTGLGLPIVKEIADAHDWTVDVTESSEGGARFEFRGLTTT